MSKKPILLLLLTLAAFKGFSQGTDETKKLGLISYLTYVKATSEHKMITLASSPQYKLQPDKAKDFIANYNGIRIAVDRLVNQLSADLIVANKLSSYKSINKYILGTATIPERLKPYKDLLEEISGQHESFLLKSYSSAQGLLLADVISAAELVHTAVTSARDFREKKIQSLLLVLEKMKLEKVTDLTKPKEKE